MTKAVVKSPVRRALRENSSLHASVADGLNAVKAKDKGCFENHFADTEKTRRRLDQNGIEFVGTKVMAKHLPTAGAPVIAAKPRRKKRESSSSE